MMIDVLSSEQITRRMHRADITVRPQRPTALQPASYDLTLHPQLVRPLGLDTAARVDPKVDMSALAKTITIPEHGHLLEPGAFVLASTLEHVTLTSSVVAQVQGRSSIGRLGLFVENAGLIDPGFSGQITLELFNASGRIFTLYPAMPIAQLTFDDVGEDSTGESDLAARESYEGKYQSQQGPTPSRIHLNWDEHSLEWM